MIYEYVNEIVVLLKDSREQDCKAQTYTHINTLTHTHTQIIFCSVKAASLKLGLLSILNVLLFSVNKNSHNLYCREPNQTEVAFK